MAEKFIVRTHALLASRSSRTIRRISCIRSLCYSDASNICSRSALRRPLGTEAIIYHRRPWPLSLYAHCWQSICYRVGALLWRGQMVRDYSHLCIRSHLLRHLGYCRKDLCERDPTCEDKSRRKLRCSRLELCEFRWSFFFLPRR